MSADYKFSTIVFVVANGFTSSVFAQARQDTAAQGAGPAPPAPPPTMPATPPSSGAPVSPPPASPAIAPSPAAVAPSPVPPAQQPPMAPPFQVGMAPVSEAPMSADRSEPEVDPDAQLPPAERARRTPFIALLGVRTAYVTDAGYDPFDDDNAMTQFSAGVGASFVHSGRIAVAGMLFYDVGGASSSARGQPTELVLHRLTVGPEARYYVLPELYGYGRVAPGVLRVLADLQESTTGITLSDRSWVFGIDALAGIAYRFARTRGTPTLGFWVAAEGGYQWAADSDLSLQPDADEQKGPERIAALNLGAGSISLSGGVFRVLGGLSF